MPPTTMPPMMPYDAPDVDYIAAPTMTTCRKHYADTPCYAAKTCRHDKTLTMSARAYALCRLIVTLPRRHAAHDDADIHADAHVNLR